MRPRAHLLVGLALLLYWLMAVSVSPRMGITADEIAHVTGGYTYWKDNDYRIQPENGVLPMRLAALPWLAPALRAPPLTNASWLGSRSNNYGYEFFFQYGNPVESLLWQTRCLMALVGVLAVWLTWRWARGLFGPAAGAVALALAVFCPALLAHGGLATSDMTVTVCLLGALSLVWRLLHRATGLRLLGAAVVCGLAFLSKMSGVLLVPLLAALLVLRVTRGDPLVLALGRRTRWLRGRGRIALAGGGLLLACAAGSLTVLWAGYGFRYSGFNDALSAHADYYLSWDVVLDRAPLPGPGDSALERAWPESLPLQETPMSHLIGWLRTHRLLPESYLWGFANAYKFSHHRPAFFLGEYRDDGWRLFFPVAFLLKTTLPALALIAVGALTLAGRRRRVPGPRLKPWAYRAAPLLLFFAVYWTMAVSMHLNIGHRHILPTYPVFYILASASALWLATRWRRLALAGLSAALLLHAADSWLARPFYLSYFTPAIGGMEQGYRCLVDSSFDWGQGLPDLERWLQAKQARGDLTPVYLNYFGADSPRARGLAVTRFGDELNDVGARSFPAQVRGGWFVISATNFWRVYLPTHGPWRPAMEQLYRELRGRLRAAATGSGPRTPAEQARLLQDARDYEVMQFSRLCHFLRDRRPAAVIGASLLVFRLTDAEVAAGLDGPLPDEPR